MYAGFISSKHAVDWLGAHQKFNRMAYRHTVPHIQAVKFPPLDKIQHFEGYNGPDGVKVKSPHRHDEPSHFYDPISEEGSLIEHLENHYTSLVEALSRGNKTRAAFEAAWLSHTITDGLTPAHHYPYEAELHDLYLTGKQNSGKRRNKFLIQGDTRRQAFQNNLKMWGKKGLLSTHIHFETGVAAAVIASNFKEPVDQTKLKHARQLGPMRFFKDEAAAIYSLGIYEKFYKTSWTVELARTVRHQLAPTIIQAIAVEWILASEEAGFSK